MRLTIWKRPSEEHSSFTKNLKGASGMNQSNNSLADSLKELSAAYSDLKHNLSTATFGFLYTNKSNSLLVNSLPCYKVIYSV